MLFLHGFPECWFSWRYQIRQFKAKYRYVNWFGNAWVLFNARWGSKTLVQIRSIVFRVVAVDMRGHGESEKPTNVADYFITRLSDDSRELIPALGGIPSVSPVWS